jgi:hypothetical protein
MPDTVLAGDHRRIYEGASDKDELPAECEGLQHVRASPDTAVHHDGEIRAEGGDDLGKHTSDPQPRAKVRFGSKAAACVAAFLMERARPLRLACDCTSVKGFQSLRGPRDCVTH